MRRPRVNSWKSTWATPFKTNCTSRDNAASYTARVTSYLVRFINCCSRAREPRISSTGSFARGSGRSCENSLRSLRPWILWRFSYWSRRAFRATCCKFTKFGETACVRIQSRDSLMREDPSLRYREELPNLLQRVLGLSAGSGVHKLWCNAQFWSPGILHNLKSYYTAILLLTKL